MSATISVSGRTIEVTAGQTIEAAVREAGYTPDAFLFTVGGRPVPMDTPIEDSMAVKAIKVASGG